MVPATGQDEYLKALCESRAPVAVYLVSGIRLLGVIGRLEPYSISLRSASGVQMVLKHAIATIQPDTRGTPIRTW
ncbi:RNA chaperone Hfq [Caballeronia humi]|uniref:RNA chaperone Hfq n=1 Tax=Caballeronia humi TaxID=326474 RepID=UPI0035B54163